MATNDPAYPPSSASEPSSGALPYPTTDTAAVPGALPYPSTAPTTISYPPPAASGAVAPYPPQPQTQFDGGKGDESKTYTDAPPPYSPPPGGMPYPTGGQGLQYPTGGQGQMPPPQAGFVGYPPNQPMPQSYTVAPGTVTVTTVHRSGQQQAVVMSGNCPTCRQGVVSENFTLLGICCAFWFFPLGIFCCLAMREKRCTSCGAAFA